MLLSMGWGSVFSTFPLVSANLEPWWLCQSWICVNQLSNNNYYCSWDSKWPGLNDFSSLPIKLTLLYFPSRGQEVKLIRFVFRLIIPLEINHSSNCLPFLTFEMLLFMILLRRTRQNTLGTILIRWNDNKLTGWAPSGKMSQTGSSRFVNHNYLVHMYTYQNSMLYRIITEKPRFCWTVEHYMTTMFVSLKSKRTSPGYNSCSEMGYLLGRFRSHFESTSGDWDRAGEETPRENWN